MKFIIIFIALSLSTIVVRAQRNVSDSLFLLDSVTVYVGIINKFKIDSNENIIVLKEINGLTIKIKDGFIFFAPQDTGAFKVDLQTVTGSRKITIVSKLIPPPSINRN